MHSPACVAHRTRPSTGADVPMIQRVQHRIADARSQWRALTDQQGMPGDGFTGAASTSSGGRRRSLASAGPVSRSWARALSLGRDPGFDDLFTTDLVIASYRPVDAQTVKRAHKRLAVQHHPDKGGDPEMMTRLNQARDVFCSPRWRPLLPDDNHCSLGTGLRCRRWSSPPGGGDLPGLEP